ncbi:MAG: viscotoxin-A3 [Eggerthellaceae bacterium]|jgi:hypothetical protein|nr:viscotoxin-A3 [Eggerthellaceae bacterium]MCH4220314.1 viscotoxin-A3 [Eggerthellaceae bacterium]
MDDSLSDRQIEDEEKFLQGMPYFNIGALFIPPIWGPAHGMWSSILFYPIWLLADNCFYMAWSLQTTVSMIMAIVVGIALVCITFIFGRLGQPFAAHRSIDSKGVDKTTYLRHERIWAIVGVVVGCCMLALATWYNLAIRPTVG